MTATDLQDHPRRGRLGDRAKTFVVQQLAVFESPASVRRALKAEFGIELSDNGIRGYDPTNPKGAALSQRWRYLFDRTRADYLRDAARVGIANKVHRLARLDRIAMRAEEQGNFVLALAALEQAAKEMGDAYTNTRVVKGALALTTPKSLADFYGGMGAVGEAIDVTPAGRSEGLN